MNRPARIQAIATAAGRAYDVVDHQHGTGRAYAERHALWLERALRRYFRLGLAVAALEP